ncbi:hypothetical protein [uncultured Chitinophaga sp.]|uniref:hypothetical protein n=1 Tax=uncultured Chitinophaga sp. TaxID=339340 RepID=UPI0025E922D0|nr:hypothetical protein [uncultured Chitinophaga sp.]
MKRRLLSILFLLLFTGLHTGRLANYAWCKWQQEVLLGKEDCGCDEHLVKASAEAGYAKGLTSPLPKECPLEFELITPHDFTLLNAINTSCFPVYVTVLAEGWTIPALRPPAA